MLHEAKVARSCAHVPDMATEQTYDFFLLVKLIFMLNGFIFLEVR